MENVQDSLFTLICDIERVETGRGDPFEVLGIGGGRSRWEDPGSAFGETNTDTRA